MAPTGTLAYGLTDCHGTLPVRQSLWTIEPGGEPRAIVELPQSPFGIPLLCEAYGAGRFGKASRVVLYLQRLGISPDGRTVVYEVTDDFTPAEFGMGGRLSAEQEGIFAAGSDGTGIRRLGPPSRAVSFKFDFATGTGDLGGGAGFAFSPDGRSIAFTDLGIAPSGAESVQIFTLDLADGRRRQITRLAPIIQPGLEIIGVTFVSADTVFFAIQSETGVAAVYTVRVGGDGEVVPLAPPAAVSDAAIAPSFVIAGEGRQVFPLLLPDAVSENSFEGVEIVSEVFIKSGDEVVQLTNLSRVDTIPATTFLSRAGRAMFVASADTGSNPHRNCQYFSVDALGGEPRQLTFFDKGETSSIGCIHTAPPGCAVFTIAYEVGTDLLVFDSSCDPFGTNPAGSQAFAMRSDGSEMRQLTAARGAVLEPDGSISVQLPGPFAHPASQPGG